MSNKMCNGCGKKLLKENSWMYDGCPCNSVSGCNDGNQLISDWRQEEGNELRFKIDILNKQLKKVLKEGRPC